MTATLGTSGDREDHRGQIIGEGSRSLVRDWHAGSRVPNSKR